MGQIFAYSELHDGRWFVYFNPKRKSDRKWYYDVLSGCFDKKWADFLVESLLEKGKKLEAKKMEVMSFDEKFKSVRIRTSVQELEDALCIIKQKMKEFDKPMDVVFPFVGDRSAVELFVEGT